MKYRNINFINFRKGLIVLKYNDIKIHNDVESYSDINRILSFYSNKWVINYWRYSMIYFTTYICPFSEDVMNKYSIKSIIITHINSSVMFKCKSVDIYLLFHLIDSTCDLYDLYKIKYSIWSSNEKLQKTSLKMFLALLDGKEIIIKTNSDEDTLKSMITYPIFDEGSIDIIKPL